MTNRTGLLLTGGVLGAAVLLGALAIAGVFASPGFDGEPAALLEAEAEEGCPDDRVAIKVPDPSGGTRIVRNIPLAESIDEIHEFHDCQRFIVGPEQDAFAPKPVVIFASEQLPTLQLLEDTPQPFAVIYNYGEEYPPLFIKPGFNCLLLWTGDSGPKARMSPTEWDEKACSEKDPDELEGPVLEVRVDTVKGKGKVVPQVTRWDRDDKRTIIGIKCGNDWCEIGPPDGFGESPSREWNHFANMPGNGNLPPQAERPPGHIRRGWYDEQRLAVEIEPGVLEPAPMAAIALPHPALSSHNENKYHGKWKKAAFVILPEDLEGYELKNWKAGVNEISLCWSYDDEQNDNKRCQFTGKAPTCALNESNENRNWWFRTTSSEDNVTYSCVKRCDRDTPIPGTVRWRWQEQDEKLWIRCGTGCCTEM